MCDGVSIKLPNGEELCIPIYYQTPELRKPGPIETQGPLPDPWRELQIVAGIRDLVHQLRDEDVRSQLSQAVLESAHQVVRQLPEGLDLGHAFMDAPQARAAD